MTAYVFDETLLGKASALVATDVDVRRVRLRGEGRPLPGHPRVPARGRPPRDRRVLPLRPEGRDEAACRPRASGSSRTGSRSCATSSWRPAATRPRSSCATRTAGASGTVVHEFEVPDLSQFRVSTPSSATPCSRRPRERRTGAAAGPHGPAGVRRRGHAVRAVRGLRRGRRTRPRGCPRSPRATPSGGRTAPWSSTSTRPRSSPRRWASSRAWSGTRCTTTAPGDYEFVLSVQGRDRRARRSR